MTPGFEERFKVIHQAMMPPPLLQSPVLATTSAVAGVLVSTQNYQNNASTFHLGKTTTLSTSTHNLPKVKSVLQEQQRAHTVGQGGDHMIAVIASLWKVEGSSKEQLVCPI